MLNRNQKKIHLFKIRTIRLMNYSRSAGCKATRLIISLMMIWALLSSDLNKGAPWSWLDPTRRSRLLRAGASLPLNTTHWTRGSWLIATMTWTRSRGATRITMAQRWQSRSDWCKTSFWSSSCQGPKWSSRRLCFRVWTEKMGSPICLKILIFD